MAVNIRKFVVGAALARRAGRGRDADRAGRPVPRGVGRRRAERPRRRRHAGRQDDDAQRACAAAIPARERVVTVEEVFELHCALPDVVAMQTRQANLEGTGEIPLRRLVKEALRMRPSRLIVGEVRQEECLDLLIALNSGLPGMCTLHANSAREALVKMCTLPLLAGENVSASFVVPTVAASVDLVVHLGAGRVRRPPRPRDRRRGRPGRGRRHRDHGAVHVPPRTAGTGRGLPAASRSLRGGRHRSGAALSDIAATGCPRRGSADMGALLGLVAGLGLLLIWRSGPRAPQRRDPGRAGRAAAATCSARPASTAWVRRSCSARRCCARLIALRPRRWR